LVFCFVFAFAFLILAFALAFALAFISFGPFLVVLGLTCLTIPLFLVLPLGWWSIIFGVLVPLFGCPAGSSGRI
jgi:hypothetical protein